MPGPTSRSPFAPPDAEPLRRRLLCWYDRNRRSLPWRDTADPYAILVSEFMLQQTQVATVLPYYERFLRRFPTLASLAGASEESVRAAWSGLGYYRRARNLAAAARRILAEHGGRLPDRVDALMELPGVGEYTAAALASIVHGVPKGVLDGNVIRVLARLTGDRRPVSRTSTRRSLQTLSDLLVDPRRPGDWNQAIMELGATVCTPFGPGCDACPWAPSCRARALGSPEEFPAKEPPRTPVAVERAVAVLVRKGAVLLAYRRDPRLLDGTWEFPGLDVSRGRDPRDALGEHLEGWLGRPATVGAELARIRHAITHRRITLTAFSARMSPLPRARSGERRWTTPGELGELPTSSMTAKVMEALAPLLPNRA